MNPLLAAHRHTTNNRAEVEASRVCGCCSCMEIFEAVEVVAFAGLDMNSFANPGAAASETAMCPRCGSEAVIGDRSGYPIVPQFLQQMNQAWYQKTILRRPAPKK